jgi:hypothetical protein
MSGSIRSGFSTVSYWSSSETDDSSAWYQYFNLGFQYNYYKGNALYVRPVRAF